MYANAHPDLSNNPFVNDPTNPHTRFPDLSPPQDQNSAQYSWFDPQQQSQYPNPGYQQNMYTVNQGVITQPTGLPFQPSSSFGQQLVNAAPTGYGNGPYGSSYGYLTPQPQQQQQPQPQNQLPSHLTQFDPFTAISQGWDGQPQPQQPQPQPQSHSTPATATSTATSPSGQPHPRDYIRSHKADLESWDPYAWKQALNAFDALKEAWEGRKKELEGRIGQVQMQMQMGYAWQVQQELLRLQAILKEASSNFDSTAASTFQMREVMQGYRQSGDPASKRRVRESCNAALTGLPDWPGAY